MLCLRADRSLLALLGTLGVMGVILLATSVDGVFTTDENQYLSFALAARQGEVTVPGTSGLPAASGLAYFTPSDPTPKPVPRWLSGPVVYWISPLHAFLAAPLTIFGWKGLVALNVVGFCMAAVFAFLLARRWSKKPSTPWVAAITFVLASFSIEYAQGVWPHMLSAGLCMAGVYFASRHRDDEEHLHAAAAGLLTGLGFGVRLQALLFVAGVGLGLLMFSKRRTRAIALYASGLVLPIVACALANHASKGTWSPLFRGNVYLSAGSGGFGLHPIVEWGLSLWARVADYSTYPALSGASSSYLSKEPLSGAILNAGSFKKAWIQSAPWVAIPLVALIAAWLRPERAGDEPGHPASLTARARDWLRRILRGGGRDRELRVLAIIVFGTIGALAARGLARDDGLTFNQRYLLDLMPLMAVALAWAIEPLSLRPAPIAAGVAAGAVLYAIAYIELPLGPGLVFAMKAPLVLACALLASWAASSRLGGGWPVAILAAALSWATIVHVFDDLAASRNLRRSNLDRMEALEPELRDGDALFAFWGDKDAFGPLQLDRDLLIIDSAPDEPQTLARLTRALLDQGRRVLVIPRLPADKLAAISEGLEVQALGPFAVGERHPPLSLLQLSPPASPQPPREAESLAR